MQIDSLKNLAGKSKQSIIPLANLTVNISDPVQRYTVDSASVVFSDTSLSIIALAPELRGLKGIPASFKQQLVKGTTIHFTSDKPVTILAGYFKAQKAAFAKDTVYLKAPELETNASANEYGQAETKIANAIVIKGMPPVNVHTYSFPAGSHELKLAKGACLILGFVESTQNIHSYDAGLSENGTSKQIDWLFE